MFARISSMEIISYGRNSNSFVWHRKCWHFILTSNYLIRVTWIPMLSHTDDLLTHPCYIAPSTISYMDDFLTHPYVMCCCYFIRTTYYCIRMIQVPVPSHTDNFPDSKVHGANMGPIWGRQDPGGPHVGPMNFAIWVTFSSEWLNHECPLKRTAYHLIRITYIQILAHKDELITRLYDIGILLSSHTDESISCPYEIFNMSRYNVAKSYGSVAKSSDGKVIVIMSYGRTNIYFNDRHWFK